MFYSKISQLNVLLQTCTILAISCLVLKVIDGQGQDWPVIVDPFPDPDIIGPEPTPAPPDCTYVCQERINDAMNYINQLQTQLLDTNSTLLNRIMNLEAGNNNGDGDYYLTQRVSDLEAYLPANVSALMTKINTDIDYLRNQLRGEIAFLRQELETKINSIPSGGGGGSDAKAREVYYNLTQRINNLENGKIQNLITDNGLWRQNFRIVNSTFAKLKKSAFGNNVVLNG